MARSAHPSTPIAATAWRDAASRMVAAVAGAVFTALVIVTAHGVALASAAPPQARHVFPAAVDPADPSSTAAAPDDDAQVSTWGVQPSNPGRPGTRAAFTYDLVPGTAITDAIRITNYSNEPLELDVYAADAFNTADGGFDVATRDVEPNGVGAWTALAEPHVLIEPRGSVDVPFTLTVPTGAEPGDHAGGIVVTRTSAAADAQGNRVGVEHRVGTRIYLRVDGPLRPALSIDDLTIDFDGTANPVGRGTATVTYTVRNSGNVRLRADQQLTIRGPLGSRLRELDLDELPELLPGSELTSTVEVDGVPPAGRVSAKVEISPRTPDRSLEPVAAATATWAMPWTALATVIVLAGAVLGVVHLRSGARAAAAAT